MSAQHPNRALDLPAGVDVTDQSVVQGKVLQRHRPGRRRLRPAARLHRRVHRRGGDLAGRRLPLLRRPGLLDRARPVPRRQRSGQRRCRSWASTSWTSCWPDAALDRPAPRARPAIGCGLSRPDRTAGRAPAGRSTRRASTGSTRRAAGPDRRSPPGACDVLAPRVADGCHARLQAWRSSLPACWSRWRCLITWFAFYVVYRLVHEDK